MSKLESRLTVLEKAKPAAGASSAPASTPAAKVSFLGQEQPVGQQLGVSVSSNEFLFHLSPTCGRLVQTQNRGL